MVKGTHSTRERVLDAAERHAIAVGLGRLRIGRIAAEAGVSRQTVHNDFGDKWGVAQALAVRIACQVMDAVDDELPRHESVSEAVAETMARILRMAEEHPFIRLAITGSKGDEALPLITTAAAPVIELARSRLVDVARGHWPDIDPEDIDLASDIAVRVTISHIVCRTEPAEDSARKLAVMIDAFIAARRGLP